MINYKCIVSGVPVTHNHRDVCGALSQKESFHICAVTHWHLLEAKLKKLHLKQQLISHSIRTDVKPIKPRLPSTCLGYAACFIVYKHEQSCSWIENSGLNTHFPYFGALPGYVTLVAQKHLYGNISCVLLQCSASCEIQNQLVCQQVCRNCLCRSFQPAYRRCKAGTSLQRWDKLVISSHPSSFLNIILTFYTKVTWPLVIRW